MLEVVKRGKHGVAAKHKSTAVLFTVAYAVLEAKSETAPRTFFHRA